jgi:hypothetical protein
VATKTIKIYSCDLCHYETKEETELISIMFPVNFATNQSNKGIVLKHLDLCKFCLVESTNVVGRETSGSPKYYIKGKEPKQ